MKYQVTHRTAYRYHGSVSASYNVAHLVPRALPHQRCSSSTVSIEPRPLDYREHDDFFGNRTSFFSIQETHHELSVTATTVVDIDGLGDQLPLGSSESWEAVVARLNKPGDPDLVAAQQFALDSPVVAASDPLRAYGEASFPAGRPLVECVTDLSSRINRDFDYKPGTTTITTQIDEVLANRAGVCQDFAHLAIGCLRSMGLPGRYVSGYLETIAPPGKAKLRGVDASHAWFSVYIPGVGWFDLDPTNNRIPNERYITTAWGRDYADVAPLKGIVFSSGTDQDLVVSVDVAAITR